MRQASVLQLQTFLLFFRAAHHKTPILCSSPHTLLQKPSVDSAVGSCCKFELRRRLCDCSSRMPSVCADNVGTNKGYVAEATPVGPRLRVGLLYAPIGWFRANNERIVCCSVAVHVSVSDSARCKHCCEYERTQYRPSKSSRHTLSKSVDHGGTSDNQVRCLYRFGVMYVLGESCHNARKLCNGEQYSHMWSILSSTAVPENRHPELENRERAVSPTASTR